MFDKFAVSCLTACYKAKAKFEKLTSGEDGMETLETIIIVAIAVIVAGFIINFLTRGHFGNANSDQGLIGYLFEQIGGMISNLFTGNTDPNVNASTVVQTP